MLKHFLYNVDSMAMAQRSKAVPKKQVKKVASSRIEEGFNQLVINALDLGASDIHIEPRESLVWVRYRVGSDLKLATKLPLTTLKSLSIMTKKLAGLGVDHDNKLQEGNFKFDDGDQQHTVHISIVPLISGEKIVLHLTPKNPDNTTLKQLGYWGTKLKIIEESLAKMRGMIIVTSADRNSSLITLSALLNLLSHPSIKIAVVGDELSEALNHTNLSNIASIKGLSVERSLKTILKTSPNVVAIDEFNETSVVNESLLAAKNHLVIVRTLSKDAAELIQKLSSVDLRAETSYGHLKLITGQVLVPKLCQACREALRPNQTVEDLIDTVREDFSTKFINDQIKRAESEGLGNAKTDDFKLWHASSEGCKVCGYSSFSGYTTINEVADMSLSKLQKVLVAKNVTKNLINEAEIASGTIPMLVDGIIKSALGIVSIDDVLRAVSEMGYTGLTE